MPDGAGELARVEPCRLGQPAFFAGVTIVVGRLILLLFECERRPKFYTSRPLTVLRPVRRSGGRALQIACAPAQVVRDGVPFEREVTKWTWYADDRVRWRLRP